jgi:hypothetical protein
MNVSSCIAHNERIYRVHHERLLAYKQQGAASSYSVSISFIILRHSSATANVFKLSRLKPCFASISGFFAPEDDVCSVQLNVWNDAFKETAMVKKSITMVRALNVDRDKVICLSVIPCGSAVQLSGGLGRLISGFQWLALHHRKVPSACPGFEHYPSKRVVKLRSVDQVGKQDKGQCQFPWTIVDHDQTTSSSCSMAIYRAHRNGG